MTPITPSVIRPVRALVSNRVHLASVAPSDVIEGVSFGVSYHGVSTVETLCHAVLLDYTLYPIVLMKEGTKVNCAQCKRTIG
jgi:hypothetical protein